ncbi:MAG: rRNA maturation RNase YbeY [Myxococcota bacterium]
MGCSAAELSISLVDDETMARLAGRFGREERPTDVLAFSLAEGPGARFSGDCLGDVVLSVETAERQAAERGVSIDAELMDLVIHGILHLLGMDHRNGPETRRMRALEVHLVWELGRLA